MISQRHNGKSTRDLTVFLYISLSVKFISCYQAIKQRSLGIKFDQPLHLNRYG